MKKQVFLSIITLAAVSFLFTGFSNYPSSGEDKDKKAQITIPEDISKILEKSCYPCHTSPGNKVAMMKLNLEKWNEYDGKKQVKKAGKMCSMTTKGSMPPKKFITENPDKVPTQEEIKAICDWAASVKK